MHTDDIKLEKAMKNGAIPSPGNKQTNKALRIYISRYLVQ